MKLKELLKLAAGGATALPPQSLLEDDSEVGAVA